MPRALKVFRTAVGFRDAYVAAPSKAAALRAWGTDKDLFARGAAELVEDEALAREPLSRPGEVIYRTRGSLAEQVAALGDTPRKLAKKKKTPAAPAKVKAAPPRPARPRPSREGLEAAEAALAAVEQEQTEAEAELRRREQALRAERRALEQRFAAALAEARQEHDRARAAYERALRDWAP